MKFVVIVFLLCQILPLCCIVFKRHLKTKSCQFLEGSSFSKFMVFCCIMLELLLLKKIKVVIFCSFSSLTCRVLESSSDMIISFFITFMASYFSGFFL